MSASTVLYDNWLGLSFATRRDIACEESLLVLSNNVGVVLVLAYFYLYYIVNNGLN
jgi:hypothetical protein